MVKPGDVIFVPDRAQAFLDLPPGRTVRVLGAIGKPGRYEFSDDMTILDLLAEAGGPNGDALQDRILVVNLSSRETQAHLFDLVGFSKTGDIGRVPVVRAGDLVYVPNKNQDTWAQLSDGLSTIVNATSLLAIASVFKSH